MVSLKQNRLVDWKVTTVHERYTVERETYVDAYGTRFTRHHVLKRYVVDLEGDRLSPSMERVRLEQTEFGWELTDEPEPDSGG